MVANSDEVYQKTLKHPTYGAMKLCVCTACCSEYVGVCTLQAALLGVS